MQSVYKRHITVFQLLFIALLIIIAYNNIFANQFLGDDPDFIKDWKAIDPPVRYLELIKGDVPGQHAGTYRPLRSFYYVAAKHFFAENVVYYHLLSLLIHISCTFLVFLIVQKITVKPNLPLFTAALFAVHPIHTEAVTFITTSFDLIGIFWGLLAIYQYLYKRPWLSVIFYFLAVFSYEITLIIPILLFIYHYFFKKNNFSSRSTIFIFLVFLTIFTGYFYIRINLLAIPSRGGYLGGNIKNSLLLAFKSLPIYFSEAFLPYHLGLDHRLGPDTYAYNLPQYIEKYFSHFRFLETSNFFSLLFLLLLIYLILKFRTDHKTISFALIWILVSLLPVLNLFPGYLILFEKYLYLASVGSCLIMAYLFSIFWHQKIKRVGIGKWVFGAVLILFMFLTYQRNFDWKDDFNLWQKTVSQSPRNPMVWYLYGNAYLDRNNYQAALSAYQTSKKLNETMFFVRIKLGMTYYHLNDLQSALSELEQSLRLYDQDKQAYVYLGRIFISYQDFNRAGTYLEEAYQLDPQDEEVIASNLELYLKEGNFFASNGLYEEAKKAFTKGLTIDSNYQPIIDSLQQLEQIMLKIN